MVFLFQPIAHSWVAKHSEPIGVVEFIGGALYGTVPHIAYSHLLRCLYEAGYTVIAVPFQFGFNHGAIAQTLLEERDRIRTELNYPADLPHLWVGHSLGCKYIALLEASGQLWNQPSLLIAPDISDTEDALPLPILAHLADRLALGVVPTRTATQTVIRSSQLFHLTALISLAEDNIAGNSRSPAAESDVAWFIQELAGRQDGLLLWRELAGGHREPVAVRMGQSVLRPPRCYDNRIREPQHLRRLEPLVIDLLGQLAGRHQSAALLEGPQARPSGARYQRER
ncbi:MAG: DUF1350 family protein [Elainellaceae cyanobacterium]